MADIKVGKITHYFDKISVAVVEVENTLSVGDQIRITNEEGELTQKVDSLQVEHEKIETAKKGDTVGMKVDGPVSEGDEIYKVGE